MSERFTRYTFHFWNTILRPYVFKAGDLGESTGILNLSFVQNPKIYKESLAILSLDTVLAQIGGYMNVVFLVLSQFTFWMNGFNMDMSLIKQMYTLDRRDQSEEPDFDDPKKLVKHRLDRKYPFLLSFKDYMSAWFATGCLCFYFKERNCYKKRAKTLNRFYELRSRLNHEVDLLEMVKVTRELRLLS